MLKLLLKFNPVIWVILLVVLCYFDHQEWEQNVYNPLLQQIEVKNSELQQVEAELARIDDFIRNRDAKRAELEKVQDEFERIRKEFPANPELPALLKSLADITEKIGIEFASFKPAGNVPVELLQAAQVDVKLRGSYVQVMSFLDSVSNLPRIVNAQFLTLKPMTDKDGANFKVIDVDLKILTYFGAK